MMKIEGWNYVILSMHILQHDKAVNFKKSSSNLLLSELTILCNLFMEVIKMSSKGYPHKSLSYESGLALPQLSQ